MDGGGLQVSKKGYRWITNHPSHTWTCISIDHSIRVGKVLLRKMQVEAIKGVGLANFPSEIKIVIGSIYDGVRNPIIRIFGLMMDMIWDEGQEVLEKKMQEIQTFFPTLMGLNLVE